ncbi:MAG: tetratricopeptide repeat protein [Myxococcales bacterium]
MRKLTTLLLLASACAHEAKVQKAPVAAVKAAPPPRLIDVPPAILYKESRELMAQGNWDGAKARIDAYLAKEPKSAAALFDAGWVSEKRGDLKSAAGLYQRALDNEPSHVGAALNLTRLLRAQEKQAEAEKVLRGTLAKQPDDPRLLNALASTLRAEKKLDDADAAVRQVLVRHPADADAYRNLAAIEADRGHVRLAESALNNARKLDDKDAGSLNSLGLLAMRRDDATAARAYFEQATQLDASFAPAWANLGALALQYRDYAGAEQAYAKAVALDGTRWETHLARGWALEGLRKAKDARAEYEKVLAMRPGQEDALYGKAVALKAENDLPAAMQAFKEYVANSKATHVKEAQNQIAAIDLRLKNPAPKPAPVAAKPASAAAALDLSKLPQGTDTGPSSEKLPTDEGMGPGAATPPESPAKTPEKPAPTGKDGGVQNSAPTGIKAASR